MNEQELKEYNAYLLSQGFTQDEANQYMQESGATKPEPSMTSKALDAAGRVLDYTGGIGRTAAAAIADPFVEKDLVTGADVSQALKGKAPSTAEYMERAGVPEGKTFDLNPFMKGETSVRDIGGFVGDIALDPATYLTLGASALAKKAPVIAKAARGASEVTEAAGKKLFKSGLKNVDEKIIEKGAKPISDILWDEGITGTTKQIQKQTKQLTAKTLKDKKILENIADTAGAKVDPKVAFSDALEKARKMAADDPSLTDLAEKISEKIGKYIERGPVPVSQATTWKSNLYKSFPADQYNAFGKLKGPAANIEKSMAKGLKDQIIEQSDKVVPGLGKNINKTNEISHTLIEARKPIQQQVKQAKKINALTSVDLALLGTAGFGNLPATAGLLGAKKTGDLMKTTGFRTIAGRGLQKAAATGLPDYLLRRSSPWLKIDEEEQ